MGETKIQWTGKTWNPIRARNKVTGKVGWFCEHVSEGCRNCYAEKMNANTYFGNGLDYKPASLEQVELFLDEKILEQPLHWRKPTKVFPCSMTDLFGRWVTDEWIDRIFAVMSLARQHTFQILTKRPARMREYFSDPYHMNRTRGEVLSLDGMRAIREAAATWPLSNVWLGTSVEDQKTADERIPLLLQTPAAVRWISAEPLLRPIDLHHIAEPDPAEPGFTIDALSHKPGIAYRGVGLDWIVVGGESGPLARPFDIDWARSIVEQCKAAGVPVFVKQLGSDPRYTDMKLYGGRSNRLHSNGSLLKDKKGGDINEWPTDLRVREFPSSVTTQDLSL